MSGPDIPFSDIDSLGAPLLVIFLLRKTHSPSTGGIWVGQNGVLEETNIVSAALPARNAYASLVLAERQVLSTNRRL